MKKQPTYNFYTVLRVNDIKILLDVSYSKANIYYNDIKEHYKINDVLFSHFLDYFKVPSSS